MARKGWDLRLQDKDLQEAFAKAKGENADYVIVVGHTWPKNPTGANHVDYSEKTYTATRANIVTDLLRIWADCGGLNIKQVHEVKTGYTGGEELLPAKAVETAHAQYRQALRDHVRPTWKKLLGLR